MSNFSRMFAQLSRTLTQEGRYFEGNVGRYDHRLEVIEFLSKVGETRKRKDVMRTTESIFNRTRDLALALSRSEADRSAMPLYKFMFDRSLI